MLEHWSPSIEALRCYDPNEGMLKVFREEVHDPRVYVAKGVFEGTDVDDRWADLIDRKSTRLNSSHSGESRMPSSA